MDIARPPEAFLWLISCKTEAVGKAASLKAGTVSSGVLVVSVKA